jgi:hypothetical protein
MIIRGRPAPKPAAVVSVNEKLAPPWGGRSISNGSSSVE